jgi:hypothetical protein
LKSRDEMNGVSVMEGDWEKNERFDEELLAFDAS